MTSALDAGVQAPIDNLVAAGLADRVLAELGSFTRLVAGSAQLARALTDSDKPVEAKRTLLGDLLGSRFDDATLDLVAQAANNHDVEAKGFAEFLLHIATTVAFAGADASGSLQAVEDGLYGFAEAVRRNPELRDALSNPSIVDDAKQTLVSDLLVDKVDAKAIELIRTLVVLQHGREADIAADELAASAAARHNKVVADIRSAVELDDDRKARLVAALESSTGKSVEGRFTIDPSLLGSVVVRVGDEVLDGSVRHRLEQAKVALLGAK